MHAMLSFIMSDPQYSGTMNQMKMLLNSSELRIVRIEYPDCDHERPLGCSIYTSFSPSSVDATCKFAQA